MKKKVISDYDECCEENKTGAQDRETWRWEATILRILWFPSVLSSWLPSPPTTCMTFVTCSNPDNSGIDF